MLISYPTHSGVCFECFRYQIDIGKNPTVKIEELKVDPEWHVLGAEAHREVKTYPCCEEPYPSLKVTIELASSWGPFLAQEGHAPVPYDDDDDDK